MVICLYFVYVEKNRDNTSSPEVSHATWVRLNRTRSKGAGRGLDGRDPCRAIGRVRGQRKEASKRNIDFKVNIDRTDLKLKLMVVRLPGHSPETNMDANVQESLPTN